MFLSFVLCLEHRKGNRGFRRDSGVVINELNIGIEAHASGHFLDEGEQERSKLLAFNAVFFGFLYGDVNGSVRHGFGHFVLLRNGVANENAAVNAHVVLCLNGCGKLLRGVHTVVHAEAAFAAVECGQLVRAVAENRNALGFKVFERKTNVEN